MEGSKLKRTMGVIPATSIGLGAMLGAGIFVFPGIAGGYTGMGATLSFLIGGLIALFVSICTAELATAMPQSGGGYFFISRTFGGFWGTLVGIAQWIGLIFASAFYLVSFGEYAISFLDEMKVDWISTTWIFSLSFTLILLLINVIGTKGVGRVQNIMVVSLAVILVLIFSYGMIDYFGLSGKEIASDKFAPEGKLSIFTTTALIFTSYLGFVQIANIGGEIKKPSKNLPRSLIGSVLIAIVLYIFVMFVCTSTFEHDQLKNYGETATIEVARELVGNWGAILTVFAGILAALSSANASIISASRGVFALSKDGLIDKRVSDVNKRFGTPHIAVLLVTLPIAILLIKNELEVFAEVASILHLIIYGGICLSILRLRSNQPNWYVPTFKVPFYKPIAIIGALSCFGLVFFTKTSSLFYSLGVILIGVLYYLFFVRNKSLKLDHPRPPHVDMSILNADVLIPIPLEQEKKDLPLEILDSLTIKSALVVGYEETPEQSDPEQSEEHRRPDAEEKISSVVKRLNEKSIEVDERLIFQSNAKEQILKVIDENTPSFVLRLIPYSPLKKVTIPIEDPSQVNQKLATLIYKLEEHYKLDIKILLFSSDDKDATDKVDELRSDLHETFSAMNIDIDRIIRLSEESPLDYFNEKAEPKHLFVWSQLPDDKESEINEFMFNFNDIKIESPVIVICNS